MVGLTRFVVVVDQSAGISVLGGANTFVVLDGKMIKKLETGPCKFVLIVRHSAVFAWIDPALGSRNRVFAVDLI